LPGKTQPIKKYSYPTQPILLNQFYSTTQLKTQHKKGRNHTKCVLRPLRLSFQPQAIFRSGIKKEIRKEIRLKE